MAGKDSEGMSPIDESLQHAKESPELNRNPEDVGGAHDSTRVGRLFRALRIFFYF